MGGQGPSRTSPRLPHHLRVGCAVILLYGFCYTQDILKRDDAGCSLSALKMEQKAEVVVYLDVRVILHSGSSKYTPQRFSPWDKCTLGG